MADHAQRIGGSASCNTYNFWNASPQAQDMNQGPWRHLETYTAAAANKFSAVWIMTGPIFDQGKDILYIGETAKGEVPVAVPHAFFKIAVKETASGPEALAFIFEHPSKMGDHNGIQQPLPDTQWVNCNKAKAQNHTFKHTDKLVSVRDVADRTGLAFFTHLDQKDQDAIYDATPASLWPVESVYWDKGSACAGQVGL